MTSSMKEWNAQAIRHTIYDELADKSLMAKPTRHEEWMGASTLEDRLQLITNRFVGPNAIYRSSVEGVPYEEKYGSFWDKVNK